MTRTMFVVKVPSTRLKMSDGGDYLAVGASDGSVTVVDVESFQTVRTAYATKPFYYLSVHWYRWSILNIMFLQFGNLML